MLFKRPDESQVAIFKTESGEIKDLGKGFPLNQYLLLRGFGSSDIEQKGYKISFIVGLK